MCDYFYAKECRIILFHAWETLDYKYQLNDMRFFRRQISKRVWQINRCNSNKLIVSFYNRLWQKAHITKEWYRPSIVLNKTVMLVSLCVARKKQYVEQNCYLKMKSRISYECCRAHNLAYNWAYKNDISSLIWVQLKQRQSTSHITFTLTFFFTDSNLSNVLRKWIRTIKRTKKICNIE